MLKINDLDIRYKQPIVHVENAQILPGSHTAILGPNGAGKSSLLNAICGRSNLANGNVSLHGHSLSAWHRKALARHLAVLPQSSNLEFSFSVFEVVAIGAIPLHLKQIELRAKIYQLLKKVDVYHLKDKPFVQLSGGEKQRVHLARVLLQLCQAQLSPLLLLDEPTAAQDLGQQHDILNLVRDLCEHNGFMVVSVLHDLNLASRYCDNIWLINNNRLIANGTPKKILTIENVDEHWRYLPQKVMTANNNFALL